VASTANATQTNLLDEIMGSSGSSFTDAQANSPFISLPQSERNREPTSVAARSRLSRFGKEWLENRLEELADIFAKAALRHIPMAPPWGFFKNA
jgi:hypothetical protein